MIKIRNHFFELQYHFTDNRILLHKERDSKLGVFIITLGIYIFIFQ